MVAKVTKPHTVVAVGRTGRVLSGVACSGALWLINIINIVRIRIEAIRKNNHSHHLKHAWHGVQKLWLLEADKASVRHCAGARMSKQVQCSPLCAQTQAHNTNTSTQHKHKHTTQTQQKHSTTQTSTLTLLLLCLDVTPGRMLRKKSTRTYLNSYKSTHAHIHPLP